MTICTMCRIDFSAKMINHFRLENFTFCRQCLDGYYRLLTRLDDIWINHHRPELPWRVQAGRDYVIGISYYSKCTICKNDQIHKFVLPMLGLGDGKFCLGHLDAYIDTLLASNEVYTSTFANLMSYEEYVAKLARGVVDERKEGL
jgi:hypothetical protein